MDNRTNQTEDLQSTPEHPAGPIPGSSSEPPATGLTAGPHNEAPPSPGVADTSQPWQERSATSGSANNRSFGSEGLSSRMKAFKKSFSDKPLPWLLSAGALLLLAFQRARRHRS